jgi:histidyl-tRNA synthetase
MEKNTNNDSENKNSKFQTLRGFQDLLPEFQDYYTLIKKASRHRGRQSGFRRITTPIMEDTSVFSRSLGENTDVVSKEMFTMESKSGKSMTLKPEATAGIMRSYIEHGMYTLPQPVQLYSIEPQFRYDRPQKGRFRQFHQCTFEVLGVKDPSIDAQMIHMAYKILQDLGIEGRSDIQLNTLGTKKNRESYIEALKDFLFDKEKYLSEYAKNKLNTNPLRILDSKDEDDQILISMAPKLHDFLDDESRSFYEMVKDYLNELSIPFFENDTLVRGLDYYCDTVFEIWDKSLGAQNAIGGGGRYDGLAEVLGGPHTPSMGFSFGVERLIDQMKDAGVKPPNKDEVQVFVAQLGETGKKYSIKLTTELRDLGIHAIGAMGKSSIKNQLNIANKNNVPWTIILGEVEIREGKAILKNMKAGKQRLVPLDDVKSIIMKELDFKPDTYVLGE